MLRDVGRHHLQWFLNIFISPKGKPTAIKQFLHVPSPPRWPRIHSCLYGGACSGRFMGMDSSHVAFVPVLSHSACFQVPSVWSRVRASFLLMAEWHSMAWLDSIGSPCGRVLLGGYLLSPHFTDEEIQAPERFGDLPCLRGPGEVWHHCGAGVRAT